MTKTETHPHIRLYGPEGFAGMRKAGQLVAKALDEVTPLVKEGVSTQEIDDFFVAFCEKHNALPATLNYRGYRKASCISLNHVVCHGIPNEKPMREGDIVNVDFTVILDGWHGDSSRMYNVGEVSRAAERLVDVTYESLMRGIAAVKPGTAGRRGLIYCTYAGATGTYVPSSLELGADGSIYVSGYGNIGLPITTGGFAGGLVDAFLLVTK